MGGRRWQGQIIVGLATTPVTPLRCYSNLPSTAPATSPAHLYECSGWMLNLITESVVLE